MRICLVADAVELQILRGGTVQTVTVPTVALGGAGVRRAMMWAGALLQEPYRDIAAQRGRYKMVRSSLW